MRAAAAALAALTALLASCPQKEIGIYDYAEFNSPAVDAPLHVFLIGLDGWGAYSLPKADMPVVKRMMSRGAYSLNVRAVSPSISAPNWASMFYGAPPAFHGYTANTSKPTFDPVVVDEYGYFPNIFTLLRKTRPGIQIGVIYEWSGIANLYPAHIADFNCHIPDLSANPASLSIITDYIEGISSKNLSFTFIHFDGADHVGHSDGHNTPAYYDMLTHLDHYIGEIEQKIIQEGMIDSAVFILCSDHGGIRKGHGGNTDAELQIPLIIYGKNAAPRPSSINLYDIAPMIRTIFSP
jgi:predicted AlkP superfamily pyrophosphatase or phosphodiesterase